VWWCELDWYGSEHDLVATCSEHSDEALGSVKVENLLIHWGTISI
jgi:hypothetical protein